MPYATDAEREAVKWVTIARDSLPFVVRFEKDGRENELQAESFDHACALQAVWLRDVDVDYVELFRVFDDGTLGKGLGGFYPKRDYAEKFAHV